MLELDRRLQALATSTSRRGVLARLAQGLVGAAILSATSPHRAAASSCGCSGQVKCGVSCGGTPSNTHVCCSCSAPCIDCSTFSCIDPVSCSGASCCVGSGFSAGWYWYCCKGPTRLGDSSQSGNLWKCQDCCNSFGDCYTSRAIVGTC